MIASVTSAVMIALVEKHPRRLFRFTNLLLRYPGYLYDKRDRYILSP
jgi:hypothetical protein